MVIYLIKVAQLITTGGGGRVVFLGRVDAGSSHKEPIYGMDIAPGFGGGRWCGLLV